MRSYTEERLEQLSAINRLTNAERIARGWKPKGPSADGRLKLAEIGRLTKAERIALGYKPKGITAKKLTTATAPLVVVSATPLQRAMHDIQRTAPPTEKFGPERIYSIGGAQHLQNNHYTPPDRKIDRIYIQDARDTIEGVNAFELTALQNKIADVTAGRVPPPRERLAYMLSEVFERWERWGRKNT